MPPGPVPALSSAERLVSFLVMTGPASRRYVISSHSAPRDFQAFKVKARRQISTPGICEKGRGQKDSTYKLKFKQRTEDKHDNFQTSHGVNETS